MDINRKPKNKTYCYLENKSNPVYFSQISLFEIVIKQKIGKLTDINLSVTKIYDQLLEDGYDFLPIKNEHLKSYGEIPLQDNHRDPFDRLLLATAHQEKMTILTADEKFKLYQDIVNVFII